MYSGKDVPAVGVSIGVERVFTVLEARLRAEAEAASRKLRSTRTQVLIGAFGKGLQVRSARAGHAVHAAHAVHAVPCLQRTCGLGHAQPDAAALAS